MLGDAVRPLGLKAARDDRPSGTAKHSSSIARLSASMAQNGSRSGGNRGSYSRTIEKI